MQSRRDTEKKFSAVFPTRNRKWHRHLACKRMLGKTQSGSLCHYGGDGFMRAV